MRKMNLPTVLLILSVIFVVVAFFVMYPAFGAGAEKTTMIKIPHGATPEMLKDTLTKYEGENYASHVMRLVKLRNTDLSRRAGAYKIEVGQSPFVAMRKLTSGGQTPIRLTVPPTRELRNLAEKMGDKLATDGDALYAAMMNPEMLAKHDLTPETAEALYLNDSYDVFWTDSPEEVVERFATHYDNIWNPIRRKKAEELGITPAEAVIIASIVDEETNYEAEKGQIARVYINRLNSGMKLQSDPTVRYALKDFTIRRVTNEHLKVDSPYNTYMYAGLPPGPIRTISVKTLDALLDSRPSFDIYMCARDDFSGRHRFAATYEEHLENAKKYRAALDARGIH